MSLFKYSRYAAPAPVRLPVLATLRRAVVDDPQDVFRGYWLFGLPILLSFALAMTLAASAQASTWLVALLLAAQIFPYAWVALIWYREKLLGAAIARIREALTWPRLTAAAGHGLVFFAVLGGPWVVVFVFAVVSWHSGQPPWLEGFLSGDAAVPSIAALIAGYLLILGVVARLFLIFPALAIDERMSLRESWQFTRGNGLRIWMVVVVPVLLTTALAVFIHGVMSVVGLSGIGQKLLGEPKFLFVFVFLSLWAIALNMVVYSVLLSAVAQIYRRLTRL